MPAFIEAHWIIAIIAWILFIDVLRSDRFHAATPIVEKNNFKNVIHITLFEDYMLTSFGIIDTI